MNDRRNTAERSQSGRVEMFSHQVRAVPPGRSSLTYQVERCSRATKPNPSRWQAVLEFRLQD